MVIDARGSNSGVLHTKLDSYAWSHWGLLKGVYDADTIGSVVTIPIKPKEEVKDVINVLYKARVTSSNGGTVRLRSEPSTSSKIIISVSNGRVVDVLEEHGTWCKIVVGASTGYMMSAFLNRLASASTDEPKSAYYVRLECKDESEANAIAAALSRATVQKD